MGAGGAAATDRQSGLQEIEKLCTSHLLHNSESLCALLRYLATKSLDHPGWPVKEFEIATEVLGRPADFDPRLDSTVRVQTSRLRSKLAEYYAAAADDPVVVEIPKGSYSVTFHHRSPQSLVAPSTVPPLPEPKRGLRFIYKILIPTVACGILLTAFWLSGHTRAAQAPPPVYGFWHPFFDTPEDPLVVYSNAEFIGRPETGLRYFQPGADLHSAIIDHYTGVGEVMGIHELDKLSNLFGHSLRVKRGRLISWDDARNSDLVFLGSPTENLSLRELPAARDFVFKVMPSSPRAGDLAIVNLNPRANEKSVFFASPVLPVTEDFALIEMIPGFTAQHQVLILAGTTTLGTQAAVEYVCRVKKLEELLTQVTGSPNGKITPFAAVIRVQISGGVPIRTELVALHKR
ncbi:MAG: hypothetical protein M3Z36_08515 [Acidobacteriota bacterium]|nr:hypothetical protein [Acidobacteriota bacterium]